MHFDFVETIADVLQISLGIDLPSKLLIPERRLERPNMPSPDLTATNIQ